MKFGKEIQSAQIPGWSQYYLDYKALKKIISAANKSMAETNSLLIEVMRPVDVLSPSQRATTSIGLGIDATAPLSIPATGKDEERGPEFQRSKAMFFFKLERELEKINTFYLQKEAELKLRLATLLSKRRAASQRLHAESEDSSPQTEGAEWRAVDEGFRSLDKDLSKLQQFIEINATGFRKILKKWDKRSKSRTKELYLARQVEVQPCFNRQLITELSDTVAACLLDPSNAAGGEAGDPADVSALHPQLDLEGPLRPRRAFMDFEVNLTRAIEENDQVAVSELLGLVDSMADEDLVHGRTHAMRILWKAAIKAIPSIADTIISSAPFDLGFVDDINGRTSLHEAALSGELRLVTLCLQRGLDVGRVDYYGRTALHYACMNAHSGVTQRLLSSNASVDVLDMDSYTPLVYAVIAGALECVRSLVQHGALTVESTATTGNLIPLSLACQYGHVEIARLLLQNGAPRLPNTSGEFPIHLAAREGHAELCRILLGYDGLSKDIPDKYNEWSPLFHASRYGHDKCVRVLLDAGVEVNIVDEYGKTALFYASWYGHIRCANLLLQAIQVYTPSRVTRIAAPRHASVSSRSPYSNADVSPLDGLMNDDDLDIDMIPSLSLPPPIMPFRVYGHNYLDQTYLAQVSLGHPFSALTSSSPPIHLLPSVVGSQTRFYHARINPTIKLVMTSKPAQGKGSSMSASYSIILPLPDEQETFAFQLQNLDDLTLEFSFYPTFGSKPIGRAVAPADALRDLHGVSGRTIPILDHRLHVIGQVSFDIFVITPFSEVALEIGGAVETYWKSTALPMPDLLTAGSGNPTPLRATPAPSPSVARSPALFASAANSITLSSLSGEFVHLAVQVTRDLVPVSFSDWTLPVHQFDVGVADADAEQFAALGTRLGRGLPSEPLDPPPQSAAEWHRLVAGKLCTLEQVLQLLPVSYGVSLELCYPSPSVRERYHLGHRHDLNTFVDAVLKSVYSASRSLAASTPRRKIVFSSFVPSICTAVNWKQPNYAVFFASKCGVARHAPQPSSRAPALAVDESESDERCRSVGAAVQFAKSNNLLGVMLNVNLLNQVPSLIRGIKDHGVILAAFTPRDTDIGSMASLSPASPDGPRIDALLADGVLTYLDAVGGR